MLIKYLHKFKHNIKNYLLNHEQERLFLFAPIFFGAGIALYFSLFFEPKIYYAIFTFLFFAVAFFAYFKIKKEISILLSILLFTSMGFLVANAKTIYVKSTKIDSDLGVIWVRGEVENIKSAEYGSKILLKKLNLWQPDYGKFDAVETPVKIRLSSRIKQPEIIKVGDYIQVKAIINPPENLPIFPDSYDFGRTAYFNQIGGVGFTIAPIKILEDAPPSTAITERVKEFFKQKLFASEISPQKPSDNTAINYALTTGDDSFISDETKQKIREASLGHILAVSGLHMSLVMAGIYFIIRGVLALWPWVTLKYNIKKFAAFFAIIFGYYYLQFTNFPISAERSYIMASIFFIAIIFDRLNSTMRPVAISALMLLFFQPEAIFDAGFQMSFAAVASLIFLYEITKPKDDREIEDAEFEKKYNASFIKKILKSIFFLIASSLIAGLATLPFSIYHFGKYSNYGTLANLIAIPISTYIIMPLCFISFLLVGTPFFSFFAKLANESSGWLITISEYFNSFPKHVISTQYIPISYIGFITILFAILFFFKSKIRYVALPFIAAIFYMIFNYNSTPDFIISENNFVIKKDDGSYYFSSNRKSFKNKVWQGKLAVENTNTEKNNLENCGKDFCFYNNIAIVKPSKEITTNEASKSINCNEINYLINLTNQTICAEKTIITKQMLQQNGTHLIWNKTPNLEIKSVRDFEGFRPWNI